MFWLIALLLSVSITLLTWAFVPLLEEKLKAWEAKREKSVEKKLNNLFSDKSPKQIAKLYLILPPIFGLLTFLLFQSPLFALVAALLSLSIPNLILKIKNKQRRAKFNKQILDAIMVLSSCLKGGLSFLQALEVLEEELPAPMSEEIGLVVKENKMGSTLENCLRHLEKKMNINELTLVISSILVARETGGDLTKVLSRLATTIRDSRKLMDNIKTLTLQGRMQGMIMSGLPFLFVWWVMTFNPGHFNIMLHSDLGKILLMVAVFLQIVGMFLISKFSKIRI